MVTWGSPILESLKSSRWQYPTAGGQDLAVSLAQIGGNRETGGMTRQGTMALGDLRDHRITADIYRS
jgi:hypothetical protein